MTMVDVEVRDAFAAFPSGVVAIAASVDGTTDVLVASSFSVGVSMDPPLVMFAVRNASTTWPRLAAAPRLGVSVLGTGHLDVGRQLACGVGAERLAGVPHTTHDTGSVMLDDAAGWMECSIEAEHPAGDHHVVILRVHATSSADDTHPLVFHDRTFRPLP